MKLVTFWFLLIFQGEAAGQNSVQVEEGNRYPIRVEAEESASYTIELRRNDYLFLTTSGVEVELKLSLGGETQVEIGVGEPKPLTYTAQQQGTYQLEIKTRGEGTSFEIHCQNLGSITEEERRLEATLSHAWAGLPLLKSENEQDIRQGLELLAPLAEIYESWQEPILTVRYWQTIALALRGLGERKQEIASNQKAISHLQEQGDWLCDLLLYQGQAQYALAEYGAAEEAYRQALNLAKREGLPIREGTANNELGLTYHARGWSYLALAFFERAVGLWRRKQTPAHLAMGLQNMGISYQRLGMPGLARDQLEEAYALALKLKDEQLQAVLLIEIGWCHHHQGHNKEAERQLNKALALARRSADPRIVAGALDRLGTLQRKAGTLSRAEQSCRLALKLSKERKDFLSITNARINLARVLRLQGRLDSAMTLAQTITSESRRHDIQNTEVMGLYIQARIMVANGSLIEALALNERALTLIESQRLAADAFNLRVSYTQTRDPFFRLQLDILMALDRSEQALAFSEHIRSLYFLESFELVAAQKKGDSLAGLRGRISQLGERRHSLAPGAAGNVQRSQLERETRRLLRDYDRERARHFKATARRINLGAETNLPILETVQAKIDDDSQILVYALGDQHGYLWIISSHQTEVMQLVPAEELRGAITRYRSLVARRPSRTSRVPLRRAATHLAELLLPATLQLTGTLIIVPDDSLHLVPFAALPVPGTNRYLIESSEIRIVPSLASIPTLQGNRTGQTSRSMHIIGDPVYGPSDPRFSERATVPNNGGERWSGAVGKATKLGRLPGSAREVAAICELAPQIPKQTLLGFDANLANVVTILQGEPSRAGHRLLHFAVHGLANTRYPALSGLMFTTLDRHKTPINGLWTAHEIAQLDLNADLVVLSACRSGVGKNLGSQGHVSLSHAFFQAGCSSVVASFWNVQDRASVLLMRAFYNGLLEEGLSGATALRKAQLAMLHRPQYDAPYYWASFIYLGNEGGNQKKDNKYRSQAVSPKGAEILRVKPYLEKKHEMPVKGTDKAPSKLDTGPPPTGGGGNP